MQRNLWKTIKADGNNRCSETDRGIAHHLAMLPRSRTHMPWQNRIKSDYSVIALSGCAIPWHGTHEAARVLPAARPAGKVHRRRSDGGTFFCPHCGALYSVTCPRLSKIGSNVAKCVVCLQTMDEWDSQKFESTSSFSDLKMPSA